MQIPSIPPPIIPTALPQDVVNKAVPNPQAVQPLVQNSVDPAPKSEKSNQSHDKEERSSHRDRKQSSDGRHSDEDKDKEHSVNISV